MSRTLIEGTYKSHSDAFAQCAQFSGLEDGTLSRNQCMEFVESICQTHLHSPKIVSILYALAPSHADASLKHNVYIGHAEEGIQAILEYARFYDIDEDTIETIVDVTFVTSPNPSTLLRLSSVISSRTTDIIKDIRDGSLSISDKLVLDNFRSKKNPIRAKELEYFMHVNGALRPKDAWPKLALVGC